MKTLVGASFDSTTHVVIPVPKHFTMSNPSPDVLVVEGPIPDVNGWQVDRHVKFTFTLDGDLLSPRCIKNEHYAFGPASIQAGRKVNHSNRCKTDWVLLWLADGVGK